MTALASVGEAAQQEGGDPPTLDPVADLKLNSIGGRSQLEAWLLFEPAGLVLAADCRPPRPPSVACCCLVVLRACCQARSSRPALCWPFLWPVLCCQHRATFECAALPGSPTHPCGRSSHLADLVGELRRRASLAERRSALRPHRDPLLPELLAVVRSEALLAGRLAAVVRQMSNANLQQLPEYHQRVKARRKRWADGCGAAVCPGHGRSMLSWLCQADCG